MKDKKEDSSDEEADVPLNFYERQYKEKLQ